MTILGIVGSIIVIAIVIVGALIVIVLLWLLQSLFNAVVSEGEDVAPDTAVSSGITHPCTLFCA